MAAGEPRRDAVAALVLAQLGPAIRTQAGAGIARAGRASRDSILAPTSVRVAAAISPVHLRGGGPWAGCRIILPARRIHL